MNKVNIILLVSVKCIIYNKIAFKIVLRCLKLLISHMFPAWPCPCTFSRLGAKRGALNQCSSSH